MAKGNIRSIRISDDMAALIEQQAGNNFTEKWENLVTRCVWELPQKEKELANIQKYIDEAWKKLEDLNRQKRQLNEITAILDRTKAYIKRLEKLTTE